MKTYLDCWISSAKTLFSQALAGEPQLTESAPEAADLGGLAYRAEISGEVSGNFTVVLDSEMVETPLLGEGVDQPRAWAELLREVAEASAGELLAASKITCHVETCRQAQSNSAITRAFRLTAPGHSWSILVQDELRTQSDSVQPASTSAEGGSKPQHNPGLELLLDVELEAALRFGCCEMPLGEILDLGPGDVVELDRHIADPVDLIVSDKIVARGEVVLINGNFGLRVTEVSTPQNRLESIRCLF
jgi:flagellar motor switch protein FliN